MAAENFASLRKVRASACFNEAAAHGRGKPPRLPLRSDAGRGASMRPRRMAAENPDVARHRNVRRDVLQ